MPPEEKPDRPYIALISAACLIQPIRIVMHILNNPPQGGDEFMAVGIGAMYAMAFAPLGMLIAAFARGYRIPLFISHLGMVAIEIYAANRR